MMVPSPKLSFVANSNNPIGVGLAPGSTIHFDTLEITVGRLGCLSLSPPEWDSSSIFIRMVHSGSTSLRTTLEKFSNEEGATSGTGGALDPPTPEDATW
jgi:hypothetical protein